MVFVMRHDQYSEFKNRAVYHEIVRPERVKGFGAVEGGKHTLERLAEWLAAKLLM
jgi:hypothetical protein